MIALWRSTLLCDQGMVTGKIDLTLLREQKMLWREILLCMQKIWKYFLEKHGKTSVNQLRRAKIKRKTSFTYISFDIRWRCLRLYFTDLKLFNVTLDSHNHVIVTISSWTYLPWKLFFDWIKWIGTNWKHGTQVINVDGKRQWRAMKHQTVMFNILWVFLPFVVKLRLRTCLGNGTVTTTFSI